MFLRLNGLARIPENDELPLAYSERLVAAIRSRGPALQWVTADHGEFRLHGPPYQFGPEELHGLYIFSDRTKGNCIRCHAPPTFEDGQFHNNGASQSEYDSIFGEGAFLSLDIPSFAARRARAHEYFPPTTRRPKRTGRFRSAPRVDKPGYADLGLWNVFGNPDYPTVQPTLLRMMCAGRANAACLPSRLLPYTVAVFKTPTLRDLGHSDPYFHSGHADSIRRAIDHYVNVSTLARRGLLLNADPELARIDLASSDLVPLERFLMALNEDYH